MTKTRKKAETDGKHNRPLCERLIRQAPTTEHS